MKLPAQPIHVKRSPDHEKWLQGRNDTIGASELGTIMELNAFESGLECFQRKCGVITSRKPETVSSYSGHIMENVIYKHYWCFHDPTNPDPQITIDNAVAKRVIRTAKHKNFTLIHPEYTWLSCSLDFIIDHNDYHPDGVMDCKNSLQWVVRQYEGNLAPAYVLQLQGQLIVTGLMYGELAFLLDGRFLNVYPIPASEDLQLKIIEHSKKFYDLVLEGRKIWQSGDDEATRLQNLSQIEPEITGSSALESFLKERFRESGKQGKLHGTPEILSFAKEYLLRNETLSSIEEQKRLYGNMIRKIFLDNQVDEIMFQVPGKNGVMETKSLVTYRSIEGKPATLRVSKELSKL